MTRAVLPVMRAQGGGNIIQISSVGGRVGGPGLGAYQAAKWAVGGFSEVLSREVAAFGIKVTVAEPGGMRLGADAVAVAKVVADNLAASDAKWRAVSESTSFAA
ncbi:SDR family NAD(P)-dependent oxidoreductase [Actinoplanes sp. CA-054009]